MTRKTQTHQQNTDKKFDDIIVGAIGLAMPVVFVAALSFVAFTGSLAMSSLSPSRSFGDALGSLFYAALIAIPFLLIGVYFMYSATFKAVHVPKYRFAACLLTVCLLLFGLLALFIQASFSGPRSDSFDMFLYYLIPVMNALLCIGIAAWLKKEAYKAKLGLLAFCALILLTLVVVAPTAMKTFTI